MTEVILSGRQTGRTTRLIELAAAAEERGECSYIVCSSHKEAFRIGKQAGEMGKRIGFPITFDELLQGEFSGVHIKNLYIDNADMLLKRIARGVKIAAITMEDDPS